MPDISSTLASIDEHLLLVEADAHTLPGTSWSAQTLLSIAVSHFKVDVCREMLRHRWLRPLGVALIERQAHLLEVEAPRGR